MVRALLKSMWFLGIRHSGRRYYWRLLLWSLLRRPQHFTLAPTLAVQGFHFRRVFAHCENTPNRPEVVADSLLRTGT